MKSLLAPAAALGLFFAISPAFAETLGTISAEWQGEPRTWYATADGGESQSNYDDSAKVVRSVSIWGNPQESDLASTKDSVELTFTVMRGPKGMTAMAPEFRYFISGYSDMWNASDEGKVEVTLTSFEETDAAVHIIGSFTATPEHSGETTDVSGDFDITFPRP